MQSAPTPPAPPGSPDVAGQVTAPRAEGTTVALTAQQIAALRARRTELSNQLTSADGRRTELAQRLANADGANRAGLEQRIAVLDRRIVQLETDIAETGRQLTASTTTLTRGTSSSSQTPFIERLDPGDLAGLSATFMVVVLGPMAVAVARLVWKRASVPPRRVPADPAAAERLERIEQAVDAIALEVERVSEGQRFVTRILAEGRDSHGLPALGVGPAEPVRVPNAEAVPVSRARG
jgi:hypothetical protein